jgi:hypothetical protein
MRLVAVVIASLSAAACAHAPDPATGPPDFAPIPTSAAPNARFYADCIGQAAAQGSYGRGFDDSTEMVLFTCTGPPAMNFYNALQTHSARIGSEVLRDGRTWRSTNPVQRNLFGVDYCWKDEADRHECVISLRTGEFIRP